MPTTRGAAGKSYVLERTISISVKLNEKTKFNKYSKRTQMLTVRTSTVRQDLKRIGCVSPVSIDQLANYLINQALFSFTIGIKFTFCGVPLAGSL